VDLDVEMKQEPEASAESLTDQVQDQDQVQVQDQDQDQDQGQGTKTIPEKAKEPQKKAGDKKKKNQAPVEEVTPEEREHYLLAEIFNVSLGMDRKLIKYVALEALREELEGEGESPLFRVADLDRIIMARLLLPKHDPGRSVPQLEQPLHYLMAAYKRASERTFRVRQSGGDATCEPLLKVNPSSLTFNPIFNPNLNPNLKPNLNPNGVSSRP